MSAPLLTKSETAGPAMPQGVAGAGRASPAPALLAFRRQSARSQNGKHALWSALGVRSADEQWH
jgi:hypothetical protein